MKSRCQNKNNKDWDRYGGRGIKISKRWEKFENFLADMGQPPPGETLDRIDNNKGYSLKNCRWATRKEQGNNKRNNYLVEFNGETRTISEWAKLKNINPQTLYFRLVVYNWGVKSALTLPSRNRLKD